MSDIIAVPTVEQINLEYQLANSKANEALRHAMTCGLLLLKVKASKPHGEWLPWLNSEIEAGSLKIKARQAQKYMQLASNTHCGAYLAEAPSIRAALELLSDKEPTEQQGTLIDVDAERKAREEAERQVEAEKRRTQEFREESNERRKKIRELEQRLDLAERADPKVVEKIPDDYETIKRQSAELRAQTDSLQKQLDDLQKQQSKLVNDQVKTKLQDRQSELDKLEADKKAIEEIVSRKKAYLDSLSGEVKRIETHQSVINGARMELIGLAAFLNDIEPISDPDTIKKWLALADMHEEAMKAIRSVFGEHGLLLRSAP
jgi:chromosome segregation ATPase